MIAEADVTRTDYGVVLECGRFAWLLQRGGPPSPSPAYNGGTSNGGRRCGNNLTLSCLIGSFS